MFAHAVGLRRFAGAQPAELLSRYAPRLLRRQARGLAGDLGNATTVGPLPYRHRIQRTESDSPMRLDFRNEDRVRNGWSSTPGSKKGAAVSSGEAFAAGVIDDRLNLAQAGPALRVDQADIVLTGERAPVMFRCLYAQGLLVAGPEEPACLPSCRRPSAKRDPVPGAQSGPCHGELREIIAASRAAGRSIEIRKKTTGSRSRRRITEPIRSGTGESEPHRPGCV